MLSLRIVISKLLRIWSQQGHTRRCEAPVGWTADTNEANLQSRDSTPAIQALEEPPNHHMHFLEVAASRTHQPAAHIHDCLDGHKLAHQGRLRTVIVLDSLLRTVHLDIVPSLHVAGKADRSLHIRC